MSRPPRPTLQQLRVFVLAELDDDWRSASWCFEQLEQRRGWDWYRVALVLERLAVGGMIEARGDPRTGRRWFRRRETA